MEGRADVDIIGQWKQFNVDSQMHIETVLPTGSLVVVATCIDVLDLHEQNRPWALFPPVVYPGYGRHGSCDGRHLDGCAKRPCQKI